MKYISLFLIALSMGGCLYLEYYTKAEIVYKIDNIKQDIKVQENQIEIDGYFENVGRGRNTGIKKVDMEIYYNNSEGYYYDSPRISIKTNDITNKKLSKISLGVDDQKQEKLIFEINNSTKNSIENLTPSSTSVDVYYY